MERETGLQGYYHNKGGSRSVRDNQRGQGHSVILLDMPYHHNTRTCMGILESFQERMVTLAVLVPYLTRIASEIFRSNFP